MTSTNNHTVTDEQIYEWLNVAQPLDDLYRHPANLYRLLMALARKVSEQGHCLGNLESMHGVDGEDHGDATPHP